MGEILNRTTATRGIPEARIELSTPNRMREFAGKVVKFRPKGNPRDRSGPGVGANMAKFMRDRARKQLALEPLRIREPREAVRILSARVITYFQSKAARFKAWRMNDPTIYNLAATKYLENLACKLESGEDAYKQSLFNQSPRAKLDELLKEASDLYEDILAREVKELSAKKALTENKKNLACNKLVNAQNFTENTSELQKIKEEAQQVKDSAGKEIDAIQAKIDECEEVKNLGKAANEGIKEEFNKRIAKNIRDFLKNNENISPSNARLAVKRAWYENGKKLSEAMCTIVSQEIARLKLIGDNYGEGIIDADVVIKHIEQWKRMSATIGLIINVNELNSGNGQVAQSPQTARCCGTANFMKTLRAQLSTNSLGSTLKSLTAMPRRMILIPN